MKAMIYAGVNIGFIDFIIRFQGGFVRWPAFVDVLIQLGIVQQQRRVNLRDIRRGGLAAIKRHRALQLRIGHRGGIRDTAAVAKSGNPHVARRIGMLFHKLHGGKEIVHQFGGIDFLLQHFPLFVIARISADGT
ncbi:hypothetical protein D3C81_1957850 [compost metagenome]